MRRVFLYSVGFAALLFFLNFSIVLAGGGEMKLTSPEFKNNEFIPKKFTCEGNDTNPSLVIEGIPKEAKSLALIMDDPDAPMGTWVHWVVYDIPVVAQIDEESIPGKQGSNDSGGRGYHGPCPDRKSVV